jgi:iron complex outermembrane receptor protein
MMRKTAAQLAAGSMLFWAHNAWAQAEQGAAQPAVAPTEASRPDDGGLSDIVVTARRFAENLQDTPVSVTALGGDDLREASISNLTDLQTRTPGLQVAPPPNGALSAIISIRGILSNEIAPNYDPSVGIYVDGVYVGNTVGALIDNFVDINRVEVLRGPQGTLYGRNTTGGAYNIYTEVPTARLGGELTAGVGNYDRRSLSGVLNLPLGQGGAALRLVGSFLDDDGYGRDVGNDRPLADRNIRILRGTLRVPLGPRTELLVRADWQKARSGGSIVNPVLLVPGGAAHVTLALERFGLAGLTPAGLAAALDIWNADAAGDRFTTQYILPDFTRTQGWGGSVTITHDLGFANLKSISAYRELESAVDYDFAPLALIAHPSERTRIHQLSQEFQLDGTVLDGRLRYVAGLFYYRQTYTDTAAIQLIPALGAIPTTFFNDNGRTSSAAGYGQATFALTPNLNITAGLRYTSEHKRLAVANFNGASCGLPPSLLTGGVCLLDRSLSFDDFSHTFGVDWRPTRGLMLYARRSRAFKSGGLPQRLTLDPQSAATFLPETVVTYELGLKSELSGNRLRFNAALYSSDYTNIQRSVVVPGFAGGPPTSVVQNAASARIQGFELEAAAIPVRNLELAASVAYTDANYRQFRDGLGRDLSGQAFQNQPKWTYSLTGAFNQPTSFGAARAELNWYWRSSADLFPNGAAPAIYRIAPSYGLLNGRLSVTLDSPNIELALWARNLLDRHYINLVFDLSDSLGTVISSPGAPRTFGVEARLRF